MDTGGPSLKHAVASRINSRCGCVFLPPVPQSGEGLEQLGRLLRKFRPQRIAGDSLMMQAVSRVTARIIARSRGVLGQATQAEAMLELASSPLVLDLCRAAISTGPCAAAPSHGLLSRLRPARAPLVTAPGRSHHADRLTCQSEELLPPQQWAGTFILHAPALPCASRLNSLRLIIVFPIPEAWPPPQLPGR